MSYTLEFILIVAGALFLIDVITLAVVMFLRWCKFSEFTYYFLGTLAVGILGTVVWILFSDPWLIAAGVFITFGTVVAGWKVPDKFNPLPVNRPDVMV